MIPVCPLLLHTAAGRLSSIALAVYTVWALSVVRSKTREESRQQTATKSNHERALRAREKQQQDMEELGGSQTFQFLNRLF